MSSRPGAQAGWRLPLIVLIIGMFMSVLDTSIVNVAIPTIQNEFGGTTDDVQWVVTGYTLTPGVVVPITAWLGDRFGLKQLYNLALLAHRASMARGHRLNDRGGRHLSAAHDHPRHSP